MILGRSFAGEPSTLSSTLPAADTIERLTLENAIYDETYVSVAITKPDNFDGSIPSIWTFDTRLHAVFAGDLYGGNVDIDPADSPIFMFDAINGLDRFQYVQDRGSFEESALQ